MLNCFMLNRALTDFSRNRFGARIFKHLKYILIAHLACIRTTMLNLKFIHFILLKWSKSDIRYSWISNIPTLHIKDDSRKFYKGCFWCFCYFYHFLKNLTKKLCFSFLHNFAPFNGLNLEKCFLCRFLSHKTKLKYVKFISIPSLILARGIFSTFTILDPI